MRSPALAASIAACILQNGAPVVSLQAAMPTSTLRVAPLAIAGQMTAATAASANACERSVDEIRSRAIPSLLWQRTPLCRAQSRAADQCPSEDPRFGFAGPRTADRSAATVARRSIRLAWPCFFFRLLLQKICRAAPRLFRAEAKLDLCLADPLPPSSRRDPR